MINILFNNSKIPATDEGIPINPPSYWSASIFAGIQSAFNAGDYEVIPKPIAPTPEPQWETFNLALLMDTNFNTASLINQNLTNSLMMALDNYRKGGITITGLMVYYDAFCTVSNLSNEVKEVWATFAETNWMPQELINAIRT